MMRLRFGFTASKAVSNASFASGQLIKVQQSAAFPHVGLLRNFGVVLVSTNYIIKVFCSIKIIAFVVVGPA